jgi:hypothetical protein
MLSQSANIRQKRPVSSPLALFKSCIRPSKQHDPLQAVKSIRLRLMGSSSRATQVWETAITMDPTTAYHTSQLISKWTSKVEVLDSGT